MKSFGRVLEFAPRHTLARYDLALALKRADRQAEAIDIDGALAIEARPRLTTHSGSSTGIRASWTARPGRCARRRASIRGYDDAHYTSGGAAGQA